MELGCPPSPLTGTGVSAGSQGAPSPAAFCSASSQPPSVSTLLWTDRLPLSLPRFSRLRVCGYSHLPTSVSVCNCSLTNQAPIVACDPFNHLILLGTRRPEATQEGWDLTSPERKEASDPGCPGDRLEPVEERDPRGTRYQEKGPRVREGCGDYSETEMHSGV